MWVITRWYRGPDQGPVFSDRFDLGQDPCDTADGLLSPVPRNTTVESMSHDGSMVLLYMVLHGSHQYTPFMLAYIPAPWILWVYFVLCNTWAVGLTTICDHYVILICYSFPDLLQLSKEEAAATHWFHERSLIERFIQRVSVHIRNLF